MGSVNLVAFLNGPEAAALFWVLVLGGWAWWRTRDEGTRERVRARARAVFWVVAVLATAWWAGMWLGDALGLGYADDFREDVSRICIPEDSTHCTTRHKHVWNPWDPRPCMGGLGCALGPVLGILAFVTLLGLVLRAFGPGEDP